MPTRAAFSQFFGLSLVTTWAAAAAAAEPPAPRGLATLEEIVVTAQKREESLKDVPISMTVFDETQLEALRVRSIEDYIFTVPNATFVDSGSYYNNFFGNAVTFRGVSKFSGGQYDVISVMVDDVGYSAINSATLLTTRTLNVERIEVLRGPQGTLTGRNSLGGSINIVTKKPAFDAFAGEFTADYGRFGTALGKMVLNVPLSDSTAVRLLGFGEHSDGAIKNIGPGGGSSGYDNYGGRIALRAQPSDRLTLDVVFGGENIDRGMDDWITHNFTTPELQAGFTGVLASWGGAYPGPIDTFDDVGNNGGNISKDVREFDRFNDWLASAHVDYKLDAHDINVAYGHFAYRIAEREDFDTTEFAWWQATDQRRETETDAVELKLLSRYDGPVNWVAGASYLDERIDIDRVQSIGIWATQGGTPRLGGAGGYNAAFIAAGVSKLDSIGLFANLFWDIAAQWHLSAGLRYSIDQTQLGDHFVFDAADPNLTLPPMTAADLRPEIETREWSPRIALNYDVTTNVTLYGQFATGFRDGYGNDALSISANAPEKVDPEHLRSSELGAKGTLFDGRVRFSAAAFYMTYEDLQIQAPIPEDLNPFPFTIFYDTNAGKAHSKGFEFETAARLPHGIDVGAAVGYTDAVVDDITVNGVRHSDIPTPNVRPWTGSAYGSYTTQLGETLSAFTRVDYRYQDAMQWQLVLPDPNYYLPRFQTVDLSAGVGTDRWQATAYFTNVLDEEYYTSVGWVDVGFRGRLVMTPPREYGIRVTYQFGKSAQ